MALPTQVTCLSTLLTITLLPAPNNVEKVV